MKSAFDANVPKRKPRTRLSTMLAELDPPTVHSEPPKPAEPAAALPVPEPVLDTAAETARLEAEQLEAAQRAAEKIEAARLEAAKVEAARLEAAKVEAVRLEAAKIEAAKIEAAKIEAALLDAARIEAAKHEAEHLAALAKAEAIAKADALRAAEAKAAELARQADEARLAEAARLAADAKAKAEALALAQQKAEAQAKAEALARAEAAAVAKAEAEKAEAARALAAGDPVATSRARIEKLKERLSISAKRNAEPTPEPAATASRVKETVGSLKDRLEKSAAEQRATIQALEQTRRALVEAQTLLELERRQRIAAENLADERRQVAEGLLAESEAMAEERDQALSRINELRDLDAQQGKLLEEIEAQLETERTNVANARHQASELRAALEAVNAEVELAEVRLDQIRGEKRLVEERATKLEGELLRAHSARDALGEIQRLVESLG
jgi:hypothetical protein